MLRETARVLRPGGRLVSCDMLPHDREEYKQQMGHVWLGFAEEQLRRMLTVNRLRHAGSHCRPDAGAKGSGAVRGNGPSPFVVTRVS